MRKITALLISLVMILSFCLPAEAFEIRYDGKSEDYPWDPIVMVVDGNVVKTPEMPPIILNERTLVPAREFFEQIGALVTWDNDTRRVIVEYEGERIVMVIDSRTVFVGDNSISIAKNDPPPKIINDKTMIPVRFVAEAFGFDVSWENETRTVNIKSPERAHISLTGVELFKENGNDVIFAELSDFVDPNVFKMQNPSRVVIDIYGAVAKTKDGAIKEPGKYISQVRYSQHDDKFRIVADMKKDAEVWVETRRGGLAIVFEGEAASEPSEPSEPSTETEEPKERPSINYKDVVGMSVVVDAGHGGTDPGAMYPANSQKPEIREKDVTLAIALRVRDILEDYGVKVIMTRTKDTYPTLQERVEIANNSNADLFVAIHCNAMENKEEIDGAQVYYHASSEFGKKFATIVYNNIIEYTGMTKRSIQDGSTLYVIKNTKMPAILTEGGFVSNEKDREYLLSEEGRDALARAIAEGVLEALTLL